MPKTRRKPKKAERPKTCGIFNICTPKRMCGNIECTTLRPLEQERWLSDENIGRLIHRFFSIYHDLNPSAIERGEKATYLGWFPTDWEHCADPDHIASGCHEDHSHCTKIANFDPETYKDYTWLITVFNLDDHTGPGTHWITLIFNRAHHKAYYYDSYGNPPENRIKRLVDRINQRAREQKDPEYEFCASDAYHQQRGGECGMFSLIFILSMLVHGNFEQFKQEKWCHADMMWFRRLFYGNVWLKQIKREQGNLKLSPTIRDSPLLTVLTDWHQRRKTRRQKLKKSRKHADGSLGVAV